MSCSCFRVGGCPEGSPPFPRGDVLHVAIRTLTAAALDVGILDDQFCHASSLPLASFATCSNRRRPLVRFTLVMLSARQRRRYSSSRLTQSARVRSPMSSSTACLNSSDAMRFSNRSNLPSVQIGLHRLGQEQPSVVGAEIVQIKVDGILDKGGETAAAVLCISPFNCRLFLRRQVQGKFLFFHVIRFLSGA